MKALKHLNLPSSQERIKKAIEAAENKTSAEIIPMVVLSSTGSAHVFPILALFFLLISNELFHLMSLDIFYPLTSHMVFLLFSSLSLGLAFGLSRSHTIKRLLTSDKEEFICVERRALTEFYSAQIHSTLSKTGILLFISLQERKAVVLADKSISDKFDKSIWADVITDLINGIHAQDLTQGIVNAIQKSAEVVTKEFPRTPNDSNELPDKIIIKE